MIEIVREANGPVTIRISDESIEDVKEILSSLFRETSFASTRLQALSTRFEDLETSIGDLVIINKELSEALKQQRESRGTHLPARGTKYHDRLWSLCQTYQDGTFTSDEVPQNERHILTILKNEYDVLEVASKKGRRNFYRIKADITRSLIKEMGHWFSTSIGMDERERVDSVIADERSRTNFILDILEGDHGPIYEFYFAKANEGIAFEEKLLAISGNIGKAQ
jgi:hypothetical protein